MTQASIRYVTVGVSLTILDRASATAAARADLVRAGEAAPGEDASDLLREGDDLALLATLADPWRAVEGAEATSVVLLREDGDHVLEVTFAILDDELVGPSVAARLAALGRPAPAAATADALRLLMVARLDRDGVEAQDAYVSEGEEVDEMDGILAEAAAGDVALSLAA